MYTNFAADSVAPTSESLRAICARPPGRYDRRRAALPLADWLGCAAAARGEPVAAGLARYAGADPLAAALDLARTDGEPADAVLAEIERLDGASDLRAPMAAPTAGPAGPAGPAETSRQGVAS